MTVSLPNRVDSAHIETRYRVDRDCAGLDDTPASTTDRDFLLAHLGRDVLHGSVTRDFKKAYRRNKAGDVSPRMYRTDSKPSANASTSSSRASNTPQSSS